ncbi:Hypothetical protein HVPorG_04239 [Roseomonas mucosa]|nr:Hypothetical protein HVIM_04239 [Roseomonas mucosa]QDD99467.1 Hypothetical protein ADP8_04239 [Roseomonas mucosa]QDJ09180.1 Hypothetical protein HVPorG_04239 [Roseomonas mucosa]UZO91658.1 Hypothetical protein RMP42_04239 [Roseomonas mucosa]
MALRGGPPGKRRRLSPRTPSPSGTEAGPRTPGFRWRLRWTLLCGLIPGSRRRRGSPEKEKTSCPRR